MLLERLTRTSRDRRRADAEYHKLLQDSVHILLSMLLEQAIATDAHAVLFGFRGDDQHAKDMVQPAHTPEDFTDIEELIVERYGPKDPRIHEAIKQTPWIRGPYELRLMPVCTLHSDKTVHLLPFPLRIYPQLLAGIENRLVSLNGTPETPQPRKYIEIRPKDAHRRLVEVDLEWTLHDHFTIHVRGHQTVPPDATISTYYY
jgi:hypothetical protein